MRSFWQRGRFKATAYTTIFQRAYDRFAQLLVFKLSPGQPRYFWNDGNPIASAAVAAVADVDLAAGIQEDNGTGFTDYTAELASPAAGDVDFFPAGSGDNDAFYFGSDVWPEKLTIDVGTGGAGTYTVTWEYSKGNDTWGALTGVTDSTTNLKTVGSNTVVYDRPKDAAKDTITSDAGDQGPFYFLRARRDNGTVSVDPVGDEATATPSTIPNEYTEPTFYGARYSGSVALSWLADEGANTVTVEVWARTDSVLIEDSSGELQFVGDYVLVHTETDLADLEEVIVDVGYRPIYIRPTTTDAGTLRIGPA